MMALNWIKMREDLHEDPAVLWMSQELNVRPETVVGFCHRFWGLVSRQSGDGCLVGPTLMSLGCVLGLPGFPELLLRAGWLEHDDTGEKPVTKIPHFERHLSEGAKARALAAEKKRKQRAEMSLQNGDKCPEESGTREEKRREESNTSTNVDVCTEQDELAPAPPSRFEFPVKSKTQKIWKLPQDRLDEYLKVFDGIDVEHEFTKARQWLIDHPRRRKTPNGMLSFLTKWVGRENDRNHDAAATTKKDNFNGYGRISLSGLGGGS